MDTLKLDFDSLNNLRYGSNTWCTTFAYWVGVSKPGIFGEVLQEIGSQMAWWYNMEEQAQSIESFESDSDAYGNPPEPVPTLFRPVAPVTLASCWSPFPTTIAVLGSPISIVNDQGEVTAVFQPKHLPCPAIASLDEQHFLFLLHHACERALTQGGQVLLTGSPGWDYEHEDHIAHDSDLQQIMKEFGFIFFGRKPTLLSPAK